MRASLSLEILIIFLFLTPVAFLLLRATNDILRALAEDYGDTVLLYKAASFIKFANERIPLEGNTSVSVGLPRKSVFMFFQGHNLRLALSRGRALSYLPFPVTGNFAINGASRPSLLVIFTPNGNSAEVELR